MDSLVAAFSMLLAKIAAVIKWFSDLFVGIFVAVWDLLKDAASWVFDQVMQIVVLAISSINVSGMQSAGSWWSGLPGEVMNMMGLIGFGEAVAIIGVAIGIRLVLQLIPFTRLGS